MQVVISLFLLPLLAFSITCNEAGFGDSDCHQYQVARDPDDGHQCTNDNCTVAECCFVECEDFVSCSNSNFVSNGRCYGDDPSATDFDCEDQCCKFTCFLNFDGTCEEGLVIRDEDDSYSCSDLNCTADECCEYDTSCATNYNGTCPSGMVIADDSCDEIWSTTTDPPTISISCEASECCAHPLADICTSEEAVMCSYCGKFAPCLSSIDPRCISQDALDCLPCDEDHNLTGCAPCACGWDPNCVTINFFEYADNCTGEAGTHEDYTIYISQDFSGRCFTNPGFSDGSHMLDPASLTSTSCEDVSCSVNCQSSNNVSQYLPTYAEDVSDQCICWDDDGQTSCQSFTGSFLENPGEQMCDDAFPCGPDPCVPGIDDMCIVFTVFGADSTCEVADLDEYASVGDYHAFAIGDNTCRMDGSGRSYYQLIIDVEDDSGVGYIGCTDDACSEGCTVVTMDRGVCSSPVWANGLTLVAQADATEFPTSVEFDFDDSSDEDDTSEQDTSQDDTSEQDTSQDDTSEQDTSQDDRFTGDGAWVIPGLSFGALLLSFLV